jgi:hypothetical protein
MRPTSDLKRGLPYNPRFELSFSISPIAASYGSSIAKIHEAAADERFYAKRVRAPEWLAGPCSKAVFTPRYFPQFPIASL